MSWLTSKRPENAEPTIFVNAKVAVIALPERVDCLLIKPE